MVLGQAQVVGAVLEGGEEPVGHELPAGHAAGQRVAEEAAAQDHVGVAGQDGGDQLGDAGGVVLVVGVEHDDHVGALGQGGVVAGLLVAAVAEVLAVDHHLEVQQLGHGHGVVAGQVVDQDDVVDDARGMSR